MSEKGNLQFHCSLEQHKGNHSPLIIIQNKLQHYKNAKQNVRLKEKENQEQFKKYE